MPTLKIAIMQKCLRYNIKWQNVYNDFKSDNLVYYIEIESPLKKRVKKLDSEALYFFEIKLARFEVNMPTAMASSITPKNFRSM